MSDGKSVNQGWFVKLGIKYIDKGFKNFMKDTERISRFGKKTYDTISKLGDKFTGWEYASRRIGQTAQTIQKWQRVYELIGAGAEEATSDVENLTDIFTKIRLGQVDGTALGRLISPEELAKIKTIEDFMLRLNKAGQGMNHTFFKSMLSDVGMSDASIALLSRPTKEFLELQRQARKSPLVSEKNLKDSREMQQIFSRIRWTAEAWQGRLMSVFLPTINKALQLFEKLLSNDHLAKKLDEFSSKLGSALASLLEGEGFEGLIIKLEGWLDKLESILTKVFGFLKLFEAPKEDDSLGTGIKKRFTRLGSYAGMGYLGARAAGAGEITSWIAGGSALVGGYWNQAKKDWGEMFDVFKMISNSGFRAQNTQAAPGETIINVDARGAQNPAAIEQAAKNGVNSALKANRKQIADRFNEVAVQ